MADQPRFRRRERTVEDIRRKASEGSRDYDSFFVGDVKRYKPSDGENIIRILPATWGFQPYSDEELEKMSDAELDKLQAEDDRYGNGWDLPLFVHYSVGADNGSYLCRDKMLGERCPICEAKAEARDPDEADALTPTKRGLVWIIDRNSEKEGPQVWSMPWSKIRNEIYARSVDKKHGTPIWVDDPDEGFDIIYNKAGKDTRTQYTGVEIDRESTPLHDDEKKMDRWLDYIMAHRLPDILNYYDAEHIEKVLRGQRSARRDDDGAEDRPARGGGGSRRSSLRDRARARTDGDAEERDYRDGGDDPAEAEAPAEERGSRFRRGGARTAAEPETSERSGPVRRRAVPPVEDPDPDPDPDPEPEAGDSPTDQARSRLGRLRARRGRG